MGLLRRELINTIGVEAARRLLLRCGYAHGYQDTRSFTERSICNTMDESVEMACTMHTLTGVVHVEIVECTPLPGSGLCTEMIWHNSFEAEQHLQHFGKSDHPVCWTAVGYASGSRSAALGRDFYYKEAMCVAKGDPYCKIARVKIHGLNHNGAALLKLDLRSRVGEYVMRGEDESSVETPGKEQGGGVRTSSAFSVSSTVLRTTKKCVWVREAVNHGDLHTPKYHRQNRPIRIADADLERLREFMAKRPDDPEDAWLFPAEGGDNPKEYVNVLRRKIQPKAKELGLPHVTWRLLRHWHSTVLQDSGVPVRVAQERLVHSRPDTTLRHYSHVTLSKADEAAQIVSSMIGNRPS